jgi:hypothetical protein
MIAMKKGAEALKGIHGNLCVGLLDGGTRFVAMPQARLTLFSGTLDDALSTTATSTKWTLRWIRFENRWT